MPIERVSGKTAPVPAAKTSGPAEPAATKPAAAPAPATKGWALTPASTRPPPPVGKASPPPPPPVAAPTKPGLFRGLIDRLDGFSNGMANKAVADGKVEIHEVWGMVQKSRDFGGITPNEREGLKALVQQHGSKFTPEAKAALDRVLSAPTFPTTPVAQANPKLQQLWDTSNIGWSGVKNLPAPTTLSPKDALAEGKKLFPFTNAQGSKDALATSAFLDKYPSIAGQQIEGFHNQWATWGTFEGNPLQSMFYNTMKPVDDAGQPRGPLWKAYVDAVETGAPAQVVEAAYLHAHVHDFQAKLSDPTFQKLYALATPEYRNVVSAYFDTLQNVDGRLASGEDPVKVARGLTGETFKCLAKRGTVGMIWTPQVFTQSLNPNNPNAKKMWHAAWSVAKSSVMGLDIKRPAPQRLSLELSAQEAAQLSKETGLPLKAGSNQLTKKDFEHATFAEPDRRENPVGPPKRWPLKFEDLAGDRKMRPGMKMSGTDGVLQAEEIRGAIRNVQGRVRSELLESWNEKYPLPIGGMLKYSANMLAMNGTYTEHDAYGDIPNFILPIDNDGLPKNQLWRDYATAYDKHKATGAPSKEALEALWVKAHMKDFSAVDNPEFKAKLNTFWENAITDPTLAPMALYANAMVIGREEFEKATKSGVPYEVAFQNVGARALKSMVEMRSFPFLQQDAKELGHLLSDRAFNSQPDTDERGLATDKALVTRSIGGLKEMMGLIPLAMRGAVKSVTGDTKRLDAPVMVDLAKVLTPEQLKQVDPKVVEFYRDPGKFDMTAGVDMPFLSRQLFGVAAKVTGDGDIPDRVRGFEGYPLEMQLYKDPHGGTHWDRDIVVDGRRRQLFHAKFEQAGNQLKETFSIRGKEVTLYMNVEPYQGGVKISVDHAKSDKLASGGAVEFVTKPDGKGGMVSTGAFGGDNPKGITGTLEVRIKPRPPA
jgi:hypothetical protein